MADVTNPYAAPTPEAIPRIDSLLTQAIDPQAAIVAEGMIAEADFYEAQRLHRSGRPWAWIIWGLLFLLISGGGVKIFLQGPGRNVTAIVLVCTGAYVLISRFLFARAAARRIWIRTASLRAPSRRLITGELLQTITPDANVILRWSAYARFRSTDRITLLYLAEHPQLFTIFPHTLFRSDEDWHRFQALVADRLPQG